jgi:hypothetical protein
MNLTTRPTILALLLLIFTLSACDELCDCEEIPQPCQFSYDGLSFVQTPGEEQIISPVFSQGTNMGAFESTPTGLSLNTETGAIDINASDPGEYTIRHTMDDGETTCETSILIQEPEVAINECSLTYGRDVVLPGEASYLLARVDEKAVESGKFYAIPAGLAISATNGSIDVAASEAGLKYTIYYESEDGNTLCQTELTIGGIDYEDTYIEFVDGEPATITPLLVAEGNQQGPLFFSSPDELLALDVETGEVRLKETLSNIDLNDNQELDQSIINFRELGFTRKFTINYGPNPEEVLESIEIQLFWFPNNEVLEDPDLADLIETLAGKGVTINGKIEERPPYILTVGGYDK